MKHRRRRRRSVTGRRGAAAQTGGRSAGGPTQGAGRHAGAAAEFEDGATVDAIAASIRATDSPRAYPRNSGESSGAGGAGDAAGAAGDSESSSAGDDLFTARIRGLIDMQREVRALVAAWAESREPGAGDRSARFAIESMRSMVLLKMAALTGRTEPASLDELQCLSRALQRIEVADKYRREREPAAAETESAVHPAERKPPLSTEELRAKLYPAIMEQFNIKRLGTQPWEPRPDAPSPAELDADEPSPDPGAGRSVWDGPGVQDEGDARDMHEAEDARESRVPDEPNEAHDPDEARGAQNADRARRAHDEGPAHIPPASECLRRAWGAGSTWAPLSGFY